MNGPTKRKLRRKKKQDRNQLPLPLLINLCIVLTEDSFYNNVTCNIIAVF